MIACAGRPVLNQADLRGRPRRTSLRLLTGSLPTPTARSSGRSTATPFAGSVSSFSRPGGALRLWPVFVLGHQFSGLVAIQPGHKLVIRHPSYLGLLVNALGWGLAFRSAVGVLLTALMLPPLLARIRAEERMLRTQFGPEYDAYCSRTSRLLPGLY